jgi:hypothetical protein
MVLGATADILGLALAIVGGLGTVVGMITGAVALVWTWRDRRAAAREAAAREAAAAEAGSTKPTIQTFTTSQMHDEIAARYPLGAGGWSGPPGDYPGISNGSLLLVALVVVIPAFVVILIAGVLVLVLT